MGKKRGAPEAEVKSSRKKKRVTKAAPREEMKEEEDEEEDLVIEAPREKVFRFMELPGGKEIKSYCS